MFNNNKSLAVTLLFTAMSQIPQLSQAAEDGPPDCKNCPDTTGWSGWVEGGAGYQSDDDAHFGRYTGYYDKGGKLNLNGDLKYLDEDGNIFEGQFDDLGVDSRRIRLEGGRQGSYKIGIEYDEIPNYREANTQSPFFVGPDGRLELPSGWTPPATIGGPMPDLASALHVVPLETERRRTGARFSMIPAKHWEITGYARNEEKEGTRDIGATFGFDQTVILPVPFTFNTKDFGLSLGYQDSKFQSEFSYTASIFRNDQNDIIWRNPYVDATDNTAYGRMAENPDNDFHQLSALLGYQLLPSTKVTGRLALGRMRQDDNLLPYSINPTLTGLPPVSSLDGVVDTRLASVDVSSRPTDKLQLDAGYTYSNRDDGTSINTYDYVVTDIASGGQRKNRPYSFEQRLLKLKGQYRATKSVTLSLGYDDDQMDRTYTTIENTHDKTLWGKVKFRPTYQLETTLKYSYAKRNGSDYRTLASIDPLFDNPSDSFYNNPLMRAYNMADRTEDKAGVLFTYTPIERLSLGLDLDYVNDDYDEMYLGLQKAKGLVSTLSASLAFTEALSGSVFYTYDKLDSDQKNSQRALPTDPNDFWLASESNRTDTVGLGLNWMAIEDKLSIGMDLAYSEFTGQMDYAGTLSLPELNSKLSIANLHADYTLSEKLTLKAELRYEKYQEDDWTRSGLVDDIPNLLSLGAEPRDTSTSLAFLTLRYKL